MKKYLSLLAIIIISSALIVGVVSASTTISTNISTGGTLSVTGTSTLATTTIMGNVGVGTSTPSSTLDVFGNLSVGTSSISLLNVNPATGMIGVNIANPVATLDIVGNTRLQSIVFASSTGTSTQSTKMSLVFNQAGLDLTRSGNSSALFVYDNFSGNYRTVFKRWGAVGIGDLDPLALFSINQVASSTSDIIRVSSGVNYGGNYLTLSNNGNLGIGTSTPSSQLQVATSTSNATTSIEVGKAGQNKGSCLVMYDNAGTAQYVSIVGGSFVISATSCK